MENRQWSINGLRPQPLKQPDLPNVAKAIVGYLRGFVKVHSGFKHNVSYFLFQAPGFQVLVRGEDWAKIVPSLYAGVFWPPVEPWLPWREGNVDVGNIDVFDRQLYTKVLNTLQPLFPVTFPTSYL